MWNTTLARCAPLAALLGALLASGPAAADLMLHLTRIVFEKNQRAAQVELINNSAEPATYRISLVNRRMTEKGDFVAAVPALPGELFAEPMLRFAPRQVTLEPGTAQTVRVMLRLPAELPEGEYRSHLQFDKLPDATGTSSIETLAAPGGGIAVRLEALIGAAMPIIVRHGEGSASVTLSDLALEGDGAQLAVRFERSGKHSVYGDLSVDFTPNGGVERNLARIGGVAVYTPNLVRHARLPLKLPPGLKLAHGVLQVSYRERPETGARVLAHAALLLP